MSEGALSKLPPQKHRKGLQFAKKAQQLADPPHKPGSAHMLTEKQAAEFLGVSIFTIRRRRKEGKIGAYPIGGKFFYSIEHLETYLKSIELCPKSASKSENTSSPSTPTLPSTKPDGLTLKLDKHAAHLYALKTLKKQK
ncbi:helix-turn-helix domain-containing protein [Ochrobactrum sp. WV_118_8]|uniref:helix-turn-helix domain-containing protein n=1 Tax=Brucella anthropi TaxID=529 RepID=UPI0021589992|nr:helix-turn-helix domain-containing protein [Brucella anthropi]MCR8493166.1 helix-turn-helix domain-containing protein [Brucella anthropi]